MDSMQHTLKKKVSFGGIGLHSGQRVHLVVHPGEVNSGLRFIRADLGQREPTPAFMDRVVDTRLATTVGTDIDASIATTEHLLAALYGLGIDNAVIEVDGPEIPIMDGSAAPFVQLLRRVGRRRQRTCRWLLKFNEPVHYCDSQGRAVRIEPYDGFQVSCRIDFEHAMVGRQRFDIDVNPRRFATELAGARTFGFLHEVEKLRENGLALGGSLENAVVIADDGVVNADGLRFADEFVRHKALDLIGDLALLGFPLVGRVVADKSGHGQHLGLMQAVAANPRAWDIVAYETRAEGRRVLRQLAVTTQAMGDRLLPYLLPPSVALAGEW